MFIVNRHATPAQLRDAAAVHDRAANRLATRHHQNGGDNTNAHVERQERRDAATLRRMADAADQGTGRRR